MKDKIAFVAVGQAGGNIGQIFEEKGYHVLYINTSQEDLDTLDHAKHKYHIPGGEGCNKDRHKAKQLVIDDFDQIEAKIEATLKADQLFVIFASGGGTGSGAGPMLADLLIDESWTVGAVTVLPAKDESIKAHINAYECFTELTGIEELSACFILDNERADKLSINHAFVEDFCTFLDVPKMHKSVRGNIDKAEIMETLRAHGMALVITCDAKESAEVIARFKDNPYAPAEPDRAVKYIAASMSGSVEMTELEKAVGKPVDNYQTYNDDLTVCCLSGLTYPQSRLEEIYGIVSDNKDTVKKNIAAARSTELKKGVNFLADLESPKKKEEEKKPHTKRDIMNKYL
jgi:cell division GTPase FtsZ